MAQRKVGHLEISGAKFFASLTLLVLHLVQATLLPHISEHAHRSDGAFKIVRVRKDGAGDFRTVTEAVNSIPSGNKRRVVVWIGMGEYREKITIERSKAFVTFYGERNGNDNDMPIITYHATALQYGTVDSATVAVDSDYFVAVNVAFVNSSPMPDENSVGGQALAMRISGDKAAFYNCKFISFQDTLCDDKGRHFFKDCHIQGTYDFIFGNAKSIYWRSTIESVAKGLSVITAQGRESRAEDTGFSFVHCNITGSGNRNTYLGRSWKRSPRVVFAYTYMGSLINSRGWFRRHPKAKTIFYGEYKCMGPGAASSGRVKFYRKLSYRQAKPFMSMAFIHGGKWVVPPPKL
ncbi:putative pectinesterase 63 isoform X2 [Abrus precatorius]|uniref:pectinesterase n=1 Tax=Abrus precatorius TaxID=3816 RepID=A0A8B8JNP9_ABRPR|nr:putative pectinesterase 63 isoform X2 [Abrus precatorius]